MKFVHERVPGLVKFQQDRADAWARFKQEAEIAHPANISELRMGAAYRDRTRHLARQMAVWRKANPNPLPKGLQMQLWSEFREGTHSEARRRGGSQPTTPSETR